MDLVQFPVIFYTASSLLLVERIPKIRYSQRTMSRSSRRDTMGKRPSQLTSTSILQQVKPNLDACIWSSWNLNGHIVDAFHFSPAISSHTRWSVIAGEMIAIAAGACLYPSRQRASHQRGACCLTFLSISLYQETKRDHLQQAFGPAAIRAILFPPRRKAARSRRFRIQICRQWCLPLFLIMFFAQLCFWRRRARTRTLTSQFSTLLPPSRLEKFAWKNC